MTSDVSFMLEAALEQMDDIIAGKLHNSKDKFDYGSKCLQVLHVLIYCLFFFKCWTCSVFSYGLLSICTSCPWARVFSIQGVTFRTALFIKTSGLVRITPHGLRLKQNYIKY